MTPDQLLNRCVETETGCFEWLGSRTVKGYGRVRSGGTARNAHRVMYELLNGPLAAGMEIDHLCRNRACINPKHLEAVTHRENCLRMTARITHCPQGHEYTPENSRYDQNGLRRCRTCISIARHSRWLRERPNGDDAPDNVRPEMGDSTET